MYTCGVLYGECAYCIRRILLVSHADVLTQSLRRRGALLLLPGWAEALLRLLQEVPQEALHVDPLQLGVRLGVRERRAGTAATFARCDPCFSACDRRQDSVLESTR